MDRDHEVAPDYQGERIELELLVAGDLGHGIGSYPKHLPKLTRLRLPRGFRQLQQSGSQPNSFATSSFSSPRPTQVNPKQLPLGQRINDNTDRSGTWSGASTAYRTALIAIRTVV